MAGVRKEHSRKQLVSIYHGFLETRVSSRVKTRSSDTERMNSPVAQCFHHCLPAGFREILCLQAHARPYIPGVEAPHIPDADIGSLAPRDLESAGDCVDLNEIIRVHQRDPGMARAIKPCPPRSCSAAIRSASNHFDIVEFGSQHVSDGKRVIARAVIDNDYLGGGSPFLNGVDTYRQ
ncbi:MAG TPA: hypothetical protein VNH53_05275 [Sphingomicrobium sp.]|nr:hypothetical protein [Sphingomicrobium sp.]